MIEFVKFKEKHIKTIDRNSIFVLIGHNIDGFVNVGTVNYQNYEAVKRELHNILRNIRCEGEWDLILYQVPANVGFKRLYGYYKVPKKGKSIFEVTYMNLAYYRCELTIANNLIKLYSCTEICRDDYNPDRSYGTIYEHLIEVKLKDFTKVDNPEQADPLDTIVKTDIFSIDID